MLVKVEPTSAFPLGARGQRPLSLDFGLNELARRAQRMVPGSVVSRGRLLFGWDAFPTVQRLLPVTGVEGAEMTVPTFAGMEAYKRYFAEKLRGYQKGMVQFLALRSYAINADPMRSGKTPTTLAAATLIGAQKVLVICPSIAKLVWATELVKWLNAPSVILYGRSSSEARTFCVTCNGTGRVTTHSSLCEGSIGKACDLPDVCLPAHCPACKTRNGQSFGTRLAATADDAAVAVQDARFVIANFDILTPQMQRSAAGVRSEREDLQGWYRLLKEAGFDLIIIDEGHLLRGRAKRDRVGETRRDKILEIAQRVQRVWTLTGTPIYGRVADLWSLLDIVTDGLFGRPFFDFDVRFCNGHKGEYGWENDGMTNAEELKSRLDTFMLKRSRAEILPDLPAKTRQVIRLDSEKLDFKKPKGSGSSGLHAALRVTAGLKRATVVEAVGNECAEGAKTVVYAYHREGAEELAKAIAASVEKDSRLKLRNMRVWCVTGDTPVEARFKQAQAYREWTGSAVFVATIDSVPVAISLKGAQSVHFADLNFDPASLLQAEDRPYEVGTNGLHIVYYVIEKTVDEHVVQTVLPKMEQMETMTKEQAANDFRAAFGAIPDMEALAEDVWARMTAAAM